MTHKELIIDSGFFLALFSKSDQFHKEAVSLAAEMRKLKWISTWPVLTETCHLLASRKARHTVKNLFEFYEKGGFELLPLTILHTQRIINLLEKYQTLPMDLADASLVILAEELGQGNIVSTDKRDFKTYRWKNHHPFHNYFKC